MTRTLTLALTLPLPLTLTLTLTLSLTLTRCANHPYLFEGAEQPPFVNDQRLINNSGQC